MLATSARITATTGRALTRTLFLTSCSFHSALKRQLKADKKTKEKEAKLLSATSAPKVNSVQELFKLKYHFSLSLVAKGC